MAKSSIMIDLDDPRTSKIADVISNKTTKKILSLLVEQELSETELSKSLEIPLNTIEYNINKLEETGLIEKAQGFFWSPKGRKVYKYKVSNKKIVISPRTITRGIIPAIIITTFLAFLIKILLGSSQTLVSQKDFQETAPSIAVGAAESIKAVESSNVIPSVAISNSWAWFLLGSFIALAIFLIWNLLKTERRLE